MKIKPFADQILVRPIEEKTIVISDKKTLCEYGEVIAVGSKVEHFNVGEKIGYLSWGLNWLDIKGEKYYFVRETPDFILGTIDEELGE